MTDDRVFVRADAGSDIGFGHVVRTLSLATHLRDRGRPVTYVTRSPPELVAMLSDRGFEVVELEGRTPRQRGSGDVWRVDDQLVDARLTRSIISDASSTILVDHYGLDQTWERTVADDSERIIVLDDLANRPHHCGLLTDQNWYGPNTRDRYADLVAPTCRLLLGPRYCVLQPEYAARRRGRHPVRRPPKRILVCFGGTDPAHETEKVLAALADLPSGMFDVDVVVGNPARATGELRGLADAAAARLHVAVASLAPLLAGADLAVGASGAATWERLCMRVPGLVATTSRHQSGVTEALALAGMTRWMGLTSETTVASYVDALRAAVDDPIAVPPDIVDGYGAARLAEAIAPTPDDEVRLRAVEPFDTPILAGLVAEATGGSDDLLAGPVAWRRESDRLHAGATEIAHRVIEIGGTPVGAVIERPGHSVTIALIDAVDRRDLDRAVLEVLGATFDIAAVEERSARGSYIRARVGAPPVEC